MVDTGRKRRRIRPTNSLGLENLGYQTHLPPGWIEEGERPRSNIRGRRSKSIAITLWSSSRWLSPSFTLTPLLPYPKPLPSSALNLTIIAPSWCSAGCVVGPPRPSGTLHARCHSLLRGVRLRAAAPPSSHQAGQSLRRRDGTPWQPLLRQLFCPFVACVGVIRLLTGLTGQGRRFRKLGGCLRCNGPPPAALPWFGQLSGKGRRGT